MTWVAVGTTVVKVGGSLVAANAAKKAAAKAASAGAVADGGTTPTVDINAIQKQALDVARQNAKNSAALEAQYNPGAAQLRGASLSGVLANLPRSEQAQQLADSIARQAGQAPTGISYDSPLLREAIAKASGDLALGGQLPQDVRNLVARGALAKSGSVSGGLNLGRDITTRDLGLTTLDLERQRLATAAALGQQEAGLGQGNAALSLQAQMAGKSNLFDSANFLSGLDSGDFARQFSAAQLGQNIAQPTSGIDPGSIANLAVGNTNALASANQNAAAISVQQSNQRNQLYGQIGGLAAGLVTDYMGRPKKDKSPVNNPFNSTKSPKSFGNIA